MKEQDFSRVRERLNGISRRDFMKFCTVMAAGMGLPLEVAPQIAAAITAPQRPPVIWLSGSACTGCTESLLRPSHPSLEHLILDLISLDYCETLNAGAGHQAEAAMQASIQKNAGKAVGSTEHQVKGAAREVAGKAQKAYGDAKSDVESRTR